MKRSSFVISVLMVMILLVGVVGTAAAQGPNDNGRRGPDRGPTGLDEDTAALLAERFGITTDELQAYFDDGVTPVQIAEQLGVELTPVEIYFLDRLPVSRMINNRAEGQAQLAETLGITTDELQAYFDAGLTLPDIVDELGLDLTTIDWPLRARFMGEDDVQAMVAEAFGITVEDLQAYLDDDMTLREIADELGVDWFDLDLGFFYGTRGRFNFDGGPMFDGPMFENGPRGNNDRPRGDNGNGPNNSANPAPAATEAPAEAAGS